MKIKNSFPLLQKVAATVLLLLVAGGAFAHTGLKESTPADNATVQSAPSQIELVFNAPVRLVKLELTNAGQKMKVDTGFRPSAQPMSTYSIPATGLVAGSYTVDWAAIGEDGHTVSNFFSFVVDPSAASSAP